VVVHPTGDVAPDLRTLLVGGPDDSQLTVLSCPRERIRAAELPSNFISFLSQPQRRLRPRVDASRRGSPSRFADSVTGAAGFPALGTALATRSGDDMKRIQIDKPKLRRKDPWPEVLPLDPRDPDVRRAVALARAAGRKAVARK
jgi:hypothetical protein